jgi:dephospho-CoA kinase
MKNSRSNLLTFSHYLNEALITFNKKAYPKNGNAVILAGGSGSGKGWVIKNLLGIQAKVFDVDHFKELVSKSKTVSQTTMKDLGLSKIDLKDPETVSKLHVYLDKNKRFADKTKDAFVAANKLNLPNAIVDTTLSSEEKLKSAVEFLSKAGYQKENIHVVWVLTDYETAKEQNKKRARSVSDTILTQAHVGVSELMSRIYSQSLDVSHYMNGDIWVVYNKSGTDSETKKSDAGGSFVSKAEYKKIKEAGSPGIKKTLDLDKVKSYVPNKENW